eukprot:Skav212967  [mRNA]  locus=scaffold1345:180131:186248:- [translate_table: standard]
MPSLLLALHVIAGATPLAPCEVEDEWGSSFLQHSLQLSERLVPHSEKSETVSALLTGTIGEINVKMLKGPSTDGIDQGSFGTRVVHFPPALFLLLVGIFVVVFMHEYLVSQGMRPILARCEEVQQIGCQIMCLWNWMVMFIALVYDCSNLTGLCFVSAARGNSLWFLFKLLACFPAF